jgi:hypothetical protein
MSRRKHEKIFLTLGQAMISQIQRQKLNTKEKIAKLDFAKSKNVVLQKRLLMKRQAPSSERGSVNHISDRGLISTI